MFVIRKAKVSDVSYIYKIVNYYAERRVMLPRSLSELYENIQGFFVAEISGKVVGCCSLSVTWEDLAEIRALAVDKRYTCKGIGGELIEKCHEYAKELGIKKIFVLTYIPEYFKKFGYRRISKDKLPHKIWSECIKCPFFPDCNEVPMIKDLRK